MTAADTTALLEKLDKPVKGLEWHEYHRWIHGAETILGAYSVTENTETEVYVSIMGVSVGGRHRSIPDAKAAAQADYEQRILSALSLTPSDLASIKAALVEREELRKTLRAIDTWAEQRCPCRNEEPNPCPLCGADANKSGDICLSAENTFPPHLLREIRLTLSPRSALGKDKS